MTTAVANILNQLRIARRADKLTRVVKDAVAKDPELRAWGLIFMPNGKELDIPTGAVGLDVQWLSIGGHIEPSRITTSRAVVPRDLVGYHVEELTAKAFDRKTWRLFETMAAQRTIETIKGRILKMIEQAHPEGPALFRDHLRIAVWLGESDTQAWTDQGSWYFHVQMAFPMGGFANTAPLAAEVN